MQVSEAFKNVINSHLNTLAQSDSLFAETFKKENKNIDDCCTYILNEVKKSGCNGFADEEVFGMAVHYYDEDKIEIGEPISGKVVVNHSLPADKKEVVKPLQAKVEIKKSAPATKSVKKEVAQISLF